MLIWFYGFVITLIFIQLGDKITKMKTSIGEQVFTSVIWPVFGYFLIVKAIGSFLKGIGDQYEEPEDDDERPR